MFEININFLTNKIMPLPLLVPLIGMGLSAAGSIFSGIKGGQQAKKNAKYLASREADNEASYRRAYNMDYMGRSDVQSLLANIRENLSEQFKATDQSAAVLGMTPEAVAAQKKAASSVMANAATGIASNADAYKTRIEDRYFNVKNHLADLQTGANTQRAQSWANLSSGIGNLASGALMMMGMQGYNKGIPAAAGTSTGSGFSTMNGALPDILPNLTNLA